MSSCSHRRLTARRVNKNSRRDRLAMRAVSDVGEQIEIGLGRCHPLSHRPSRVLGIRSQLTSISYRVSSPFQQPLLLCCPAVTTVLPASRPISPGGVRPVVKTRCRASCGDGAN
jgi:hypothetical protein